MMGATQLAVTTGLFGVLGAAITYRLLQPIEHLTDYTRKRVWLLTSAGAGVAAGISVLFYLDQAYMPAKWSWMLRLVFLIGLVLTSYRKPPQVSDVERQSTHRIQIGILIGGILLGVCVLILNLFW